MATKKTKTPTPAEPSKSKHLQITGHTGKTQDRRLAEIAADGVATGACLLVDFGKATFGTLSLTDAVGVIDDTAKSVHGGSLKSAETMLTAQAVALNAIFGELARRSAMNMGEYLDASERYMRLALKAQGQCRATLETLAAVKNPPVVFARQANINNGGQQQVNNSAQPETQGTPTAHAAKPEFKKNELLEHQHGNYLDTGAQSTAGRADPHMEAVEVGHRAKHA
jgi:hypothetical protein